MRSDCKDPKSVSEGKRELLVQMLWGRKRLGPVRYYTEAAGMEVR